MIINAKSRLPDLDISLGFQIFVFLVFAAYALGMTVYNAKKARRINELKTIEGYPFDPNDLKFNSYKTIGIIVGICFLTGILGGVIGIAGGIILAPLFLQMGMLP